MKMKEINEMNKHARKMKKLLASIDEMISNKEKLLVLMKTLRLYYTVYNYFPNLKEDGGKFIITKKKNVLGMINNYRDYPLQIKGVKGKRTDPDVENIIICDFDSPHNKRDFVEIPPFDLPEPKKDVYTFAPNKKKKKSNRGK